MSASLRFEKAFTQQEGIPQAGIDRAVELLQNGRLHRYNTLGHELSEASLLEAEYAEYQGSEYCLACTSGGYAMHVALKAAGLKAGEKVLTNAFTLAPVPGAIDNAGGHAVLVEIDENYCIDLQHLEDQAKGSDAKWLLLSHMRGHIVNMADLGDICERHGITLIEDCAHTMAASWDGVKSGNFGKVACFSTQTYKHLNSGEGGLLTTNDPEIAARATVMSGSYMLYERHGAGPVSQTFKELKWLTPNYSGRMDNLRAAILRAQLPELDLNAARWNERYYVLADILAGVDGLQLPQRDEREVFVGSSIQFRLPEFSDEKIQSFMQRLMARGVELKWFGGKEPQGFTSRYDSWQYLQDMPELPHTDRILRTMLDMRIPLTFTLDDMALIGTIIAEEVHG